MFKTGIFASFSNLTASSTRLSNNVISLGILSALTFLKNFVANETKLSES